ncbi:hypothetical protein IGI04_024971 [Brassica rapa subsp. trilocularis]|uniref:Pectate lyase n=1 Tax=Brassica rapa subsp. trilocularis TaxID=1813537 RepID=A0ABQ7MAA4_BRACM|nr:hypothetical protein IGI04_024971 [Brassica rapa subsp. trilocularis]
MASAHLNLGSYVFAFVSLSLAVVAPSVQGHVAVYDEYWTQRQTDALRETIKSYDPNPFNVTDHFNYHAALAMETTGADNGTRRELRQVRRGRKTRRRGGRHHSLNAIDKCWRGDKNWHKNRKKLADCVLGFGRKTTGGKKGQFYVVTDASDHDLINPKPGTLRHAVTRDRPLWIIFGRSMIIKLQQELIITHDKTIDGRGANVHIMGGAGLTLQFVKNVIIHNIHIKHIKCGAGGMIRDCEHHVGQRSKSDGDGINIFGATNIWIDHVLLFGGKDGDVIDKKMQITVAFNHFGKRLVQRMPRVRYGLVHVVNNDYTHWEMYAIGGNKNPTIISQGNRFIAPHKETCKQVTKREYTPYTEWKSWNWQSERDYFLNGAYFVNSGRANAWSPAPKNPIHRKFAIRPQSGTGVRRLTKDAGTLGCTPGKSC